MPVSMNISLLAHILLDSESSGRFGVQGNTFDNTVGYLNQYFKTLPDMPAKLKVLADAMDALAAREKEIKALRVEALSFALHPQIDELADSIYELFSGKNLKKFVSLTATQINALQPNQNLLLPGGWMGTGSSGHAMIYQFEKDADGHVLFSIYNAGGGLEFHEKTSSKQKELFSPVKQYKIPDPVDPKELQNLVKRLIVPQLPPVPGKAISWNAEKVYQEIETSLVFLKAEHVMQDLSTARETTASQLSGTCSQRSIHQMLKINFDTLPEYQRFIFDFKMHALKDFIATHPVPPRSPKITAFVQKAIIHNLKILQEPGVFNDAQEQARALQELTELQHRLEQTDEQQVMSTGLNVDFEPLLHFANSFLELFPFNDLAMNITSFDTKDNLEPVKDQPLLRMLRGDHLLADLAEVINECEMQQFSNPMWVMAQIEQTVLQLPVPSSCNKEKPYYETLPFYHTISTVHDFDTIAKTIDKLHVLYARASQKALNDATIPTQVITCCSLLALRDYFDATGESVTNTPSFHRYLHPKLTSFFRMFRSYPYLATNNPKADQRLNDLLNNTNMYVTRPSLDERESYGLCAYIPDPVTGYQELLDTEPDLKKSLEEEIFEVQQRKNDKSHTPEYQVFYQSLRDENLLALFMVLNEFDDQRQLKTDSLLAADRFKPLIKKFQQRFALEKVFISYLEPFKETFLGDKYCFYSGNRKTMWGGGFDQETDIDRVCVQGITANESSMSRLTMEREYNPKYAINVTDWVSECIFWRYVDAIRLVSSYKKKCITHHKYNLSESSALTALGLTNINEHIFRNSLGYSDGSNAIQLASNDYFSRDLFQLRLSPAHQIKLTLDYFNKTESIGKLEDRNIQLYVEANLFEPGLLITALNTDSVFIPRLNAFIERGLAHFVGSDGLLTHESLFFIQLGMNVYRYAVLNNPDGVAIQRLRDAHAELNKLMSLQTEPYILASLHRDRFLNAMALHPLQPDDNALSEEAVVSYAYLQTKHNPYRPDDTARRFELQRAGLHFKEWLREINPEIIATLVEPTVNSLGLEVNHLSLVSQSPWFHYQDKTGTTIYTVNVESGRVFQKGYSLTSTPVDIINHPVTHRLGLAQESSCWISTDEKEILFKTGHVRMKKQGAALAVQKKWSVNNELAKWYELKPLTKNQRYMTGLEENELFQNKLPEILTDGTIEAWVSETDLLLVQNNKPIYQVDKRGQIYQLGQDGRSNARIRTTPSPAYAKALTQFEDPGFFSVNLDQLTRTQGTVDFARYGITLDVSGNQITIPDTNYTLMSPEASPFASNIACLTFDNGTDQLVIVAFQPFYVASSTQQIAGEYYQLTHDTTGHIPELLMGTKSAKDMPAWNYHQSQRAISYKLVHGEPRPDSAADALYLCYLYLACHETDKAWSVLDDISQRLSLSGSMDELTCLSWIIERLPFVQGKKTATDYTLDTPEYVACQLKAIALYTDYLALGQAPVFPGNKAFDTRYANGLYEQVCFKNIEKIYNQLSDTIHHLYSRHQQGERHLDEKYMLRDEERKGLLHYCYPDPSIALGALGYERRRLSLKTLLKEYQRLIAVRDTSPDFSPAFNKRLANIEKSITNERRVMKKSTRLEWIPIDLSFPNNFSFNMKNLKWDMYLQVESWLKDQADLFAQPLDIETSMAMLDSAMEDSEFLTRFPTYLHIARSGSPEQIAELKQFCTSCLKTFSRPSGKYNDKNMPFLTNILYRVLENPALFSEPTMTILTLIEKAFHCDVPPVIVPQTRDVFDEILATNQDIWDELNNNMSASVPMPAVTPMYSEPLWHMLGMQDSMQGYRAEEDKYNDAMRSLSLGPTAERAAGELKYDCLLAQRHIAETELKDPAIRTRLITEATGIQKNWQDELESIWTIAISLANALPDDATQARERQIQLLAKQQRQLDKRALLTLYLHADLTLYIEKTGLSRDDCITLHERIHRGVSLDVKHQQITRLINALDQASKNSPPDNGDLHQIASTLMSENIPQAQTEPSLMLFQYAENILVRPRQAEVLASLLAAETNVVEKVIMGGGKSKVIEPLLAEKKATGLNLVIQEVPRSLLATNHVDFNCKSQQLFGQKAHRFEFNRDSDCSPERLQSIYHEFVEIMINKDYLVTTGEAMQSLELKYLEILLSRPKNEAEISLWEKQVHWASKITGLLKQCGDVVIDEVHQGLLLKKKLNYTLGDLRNVSPVIIKHSIALFQFVDALNGQSLTIDELLLNENSPLKPFIDKLKYPHVIKELRAYFKNEKMPTFISHVDEDVKDALAFYKEQLTLLPKTRSRRFKENFGPSEVQDTALKRAIAIPYTASNQPNERSRFGSPFALETINYSILSLLNEGLNEELLTGAIAQWQIEAREELQMPSSPYRTMADTPTALRINSILQGTGLTLQTINLRSEAAQTQLGILFEQLKHNRTLLYALLQDQILSQITLERSILHSDSLNHVSMFNRVDGVSGTPSNYTTYHQSLRYNPITSLGTDGYIQTVLEKKPTPIMRASCTDLDSFLSGLFKDKQNVRAIIDISATFAGVSNLDVAQKLAEYSSGQIPPIQYVLYFNEADVLCALNIKTKKTIILATSDPVEINQKLGCTPDERITYYDQSHTVGADLKQASHAHAFVLADSRTHLQSFLQGCMRMRGLDEQQTISIVVPEDTPDLLEDLFALMTKNEQDQLMEDNFFAAIAKMNDLVRQDCLQRIANVPDDQIDEKYKLGQAFKRYLVQTKTQSLFEQYGNIYTEELTSELLKRHQMTLMRDWKTCLTDAEIEATEPEANALDASLGALVEQSIPLCKEKSRSIASTFQDVGIEVELEKETQKEMEQEQLKEVINADPSLVPEDRHYWTEEDEESLLMSFKINGCTVVMVPVTTYTREGFFSQHLLLDFNYLFVHKNQTRILFPYLKSVEAILFRQSGDTLTACLIDMEDLAELHGLINSDGEEPKIWISDTQHTILEGAFPDGILQNKDYQSLIEQIRFFNGECNGLREQETPWCWLNENTEKKLAFFQEHIMPYRQTKVGEFKALQEAASQLHKNLTPPDEDKKAISITATKESKMKLQDVKEGDDSSLESQLKTGHKMR